MSDEGQAASMGSAGVSWFDEPAIYRIRVLGLLDDRWRDRPGGLELETFRDPGGSTHSDLTGVLFDQPALMGLLGHLYSRGVTLIRVERLEGARGETDKGGQ